MLLHLIFTNSTQGQTCLAHIIVARLDQLLVQPPILIRALELRAQVKPRAYISVIYWQCPNMTHGVKDTKTEIEVRQSYCRLQAYIDRYGQLATSQQLPDLSKTTEHGLVHRASDIAESTDEGKLTIFGMLTPPAILILSSHLMGMGRSRYWQLGSTC